ncbi:hypothetical protein DXC92_01745 [Clostridiales bacterium TF09-2AC]|nr:hypothetical protein DXC92_01745 [Clostridiales bacterium TF09-2AC]
MSIRKEAETEKQKLRNMPPKDRAWYIWEYYKFHILALILAVAALWTLGGILYRQTFTTRLSIAIVNDRAGNASSTANLEAGLKEALGFGKKDLIEINEGLTARFGEEGMSQFEYASLAKISALVASRSLDVFIGDQEAVDHYETVNAFQDLEEYLPPELYSRVKDSVYSAEDEQGVLKPVALSLEGTSFASQTGVVMNPPYLSVMSTSQHKEEVLQMIEYLFR